MQEILHNWLIFFFLSINKTVSGFESLRKAKNPKSMNSPKWNSKARLVGTVHSIYSDLLAFFKDILDSPQSWDDATVDAAGGYVSKLKSAEFMFLLEVFQNIFPHTELLFNILQTRRFDISYCNARVDNVKDFIT